MMRSECGWGLGRGTNLQFAEDFKMELLCKGSCLDVAHVAVNLVQRFIMQENPILMYTHMRMPDFNSVKEIHANIK